jgi:hypothetical protein
MRCGTVLPVTSLLLNGMGSHTCMGCQAHAESQQVLRKTVINTALGAPSLTILAYVVFLIPIVNLVLPGLLAFAGGWQAVGGVRLWAELNRRRDDHGVDGALQLVLIAGSVIALCAGLGAFGIQALTWLALLLS